MEKPEDIAGPTRPTIEVKALDEQVGRHLPHYATVGSAGMELRACFAEAQAIAPGDTIPIPAGTLRWKFDPTAREQRGVGRSGKH